MATLRYVVSLKDQVTNRLRRIGGAVARIGLGFGAIATSSALAAAASVRAADNIAKSARRIGLTTEAYQALDLAIRDAGGSADRVLGTGIQRFTRAIGEAAKGTGRAAETFETLGINIRDASGNLRGSTNLLDEVAVAMDRVESQAERAALGASLFDRSWADLDLVLRQQGGLDTIISRGRSLGVILNEDLLTGAEETASRMDVFGKQISTLGIRIGVLLEGPANGLLDFLIETTANANAAIAALATSETASLTEEGKLLFNIATTKARILQIDTERKRLDDSPSIGAAALDAKLERERELLNQRLVGYDEHLEQLREKNRQAAEDQKNNPILPPSGSGDDAANEFAKAGRGAASYAATAVEAWANLEGANNTTQSAAVVANAAAGISRQFADLPFPLALATSTAIGLGAAEQLASIGSGSLPGAPPQANQNTTNIHNTQPNIYIQGRHFGIENIRQLDRDLQAANSGQLQA